METLLSPLINSAESIMIYINSLGFSWGMCIIIMAILLRILVLPATLPQMHQIRKFKVLGKEVSKIKEKFSTDNNQMTREIMRLYSENKANVYGLFLPVIIQVPFYAALFFLLRSDEFKADIGSQASFLFINNLTAPITAQFSAMVILMLLYFISQMASSIASHDLKNNKSILIVSFLFAFIGSFVILTLNFPTGLVLFWITGNLWLLGQNIVIRLLPPYPITSFEEIYENNGPADESFGLPSFLTEFQAKQQNIAKQIENEKLNQEYLSSLEYIIIDSNYILDNFSNELKDNDFNNLDKEAFKLENILNQQSHNWLVKDKENNNLAFASLSNNKFVIFVKEIYRNKGIGHKLLQLVEEQQATSNIKVKRTILKTLSIEDFYQHRGYQLENDYYQKEISSYRNYKN